MSPCISIVAPASHTCPTTLETAALALETMGVEIRLPASLQSPRRYLAGSIEHRLEGLYAAYADPDTQAVWAARGGYGGAHLIEHIDWSRLSPNKPLIGYSDISVLLDQCYRHGLPAIHGPVMKEAALMRHDAEEQRRVAQRHIEELVALLRDETPAPFPLHPCRQDERHVRHAALEGPVVGGNLTTLACVAGTPARFTAPPGALVILEDVGEPYYRLERALWQLVHSGAFDRAGAICMGTFEGCTPYDETSLETIFAEVLRPLALPLFGGLPVGHGLHNRPWRYGGHGCIIDGHLELKG
ncbi:muramoyltetrapeptide carboxypeptidase [Modicisalibacter ilicicola DSM 19980]|uniref:Muramoyltetrapeptide carboxypeptidase n=1 Tax=Modicisalibacter ilicicola DSM 19980 TaxID=1121942 RepID=A0A1M4WZI2_9GAMM|nr:LD-carboxypeptidase [Halomonas ilicicola]SHE86658.1 muramoyltetrapeptide carboxypeptidase [Halomonas ilicicola DSM 19980]